MAAPLERTSIPGIYKRGSRYVVAVTIRGKQLRPAFASLTEAASYKQTRSGLQESA